MKQVSNDSTKAYDFTPLEVAPSAEDRAAFFKASEAYANVDKANKRTMIIMTVIAFILVCFIGINVIVRRNADSSSTPMIAAMVAVVFVGAIAFSSKYRRDRLTKLYTFAAKNDLTFRFDEPITDKTMYHGLIFDEGHSRIREEILLFKDDTELGSYKYTKGNGKNRSTYKFGYARLKLERPVPNILLDSRKNNPAYGSNLPDTYAASQKLSLEGDFDTHFTLYAPTEYKTDALYILTPDVMSVLVDQGGDFDVELVDDYMYIYSGSDPFKSAEQLKKWITVVESLRKELGKQTKSYRDDKVAANVPAASKESSVVGESGKRLTKGNRWNIIAVMGLVIAVFIFVPFMEGTSREFLNYIIGAAIAGVVIKAIVSKSRKGKS